MIAPADQFGPWRDGIEPAERLARLSSDADARCSCFSCLPDRCTLTQGSRNGGRSCVDGCGSLIPVVTAVISISGEACLVVVRKFRVYPLVQHQHGLIVVGQKIAICSKVLILPAPVLIGPPRRARPTEENLKRPQKAHGVHQLKSREGELNASVTAQQRKSP